MAINSNPQNTAPTVSVLMSAYNSQDYIEDTITSVLNQTFEDFEFIIVEDGSTDDTAKIIRKYEQLDSRIKVDYLEKNHANVSLTLNIGLKKCTGKYIARIDADDMWFKDKLKVQLDAFNNDSDLFLATSPCFYIDKLNNVLSKTPTDGPYNYDEFKKKFIKRFFICTCAVIFKRSIVEDIGMFDESILYVEDYDYFLRICQKYKCITLSEPMAYYRFSPNMISIRNRKGQAWLCVKVRNRIIKESNYPLWYYLYNTTDILNVLKPTLLIKLKKYFLKNILKKDPLTSTLRIVKHDK